MIAGVMLASCANNDNNDNNDKKDEKNKNQITLNTLSKEARETLAGQLGVEVANLQTAVNKFKLDTDDIDETTGELKPSGALKKRKVLNAEITEMYNSLRKERKERELREFIDADTHPYLKKKKDGKNKINVRNLDPSAKTTLAQQLGVPVHYLQYKIDKLNLTEKDINIKTGELNESGVKKNKKAEYSTIKKIFKSVSEEVHSEEVDAEINRLKAAYSKINEFAKSVSEELDAEINRLKAENNRLKLDKADIDKKEELNVSELQNKKNAEVIAKAEIQIKAVLDESIKTDDEIQVNDFEQLAKTLKQLIETTQNLLNGKYNDNNNDKFLADIEKVDEFYEVFIKKDGSDYKNAIKTDGEINVSDLEQLANTFKQVVEATQNLVSGKYKDDNTDKFLADVEKLEELHAAFGNKTNYEHAIQTEFNDKLNAITNALINVKEGILTENIITNTSALNLNQKIDSKTIYTVILELLNSDSTTNVINDYIDAKTAKITVEKDGIAKLKLVFANNDTFDEKGIVAFAEKDRVGGDKIQAITSDFTTKLAEQIATLTFGTVDKSTNCKTQIINGYIKNKLTFDWVASMDPADITEETLKEYCGKTDNCILTEDDVRYKIVEPVMEKVFGIAHRVKDVFTKVKNLLAMSVGRGKILMRDGLASICDDTNGTPISNTSKATDQFGTATRLTNNLLAIREAIICYNLNDGLLQQ